MGKLPEPHWLPFAPELGVVGSSDALVALAEQLAGSPSGAPAAARLNNVDRARREFVRRRLGSGKDHSRATRAAGLILCDLARQGWAVRLRENEIEIARRSPDTDSDDARKRIREQLHAERADQLNAPATRAWRPVGSGARASGRCFLLCAMAANCASD
jgi:hypothetical protein